MNNSKAEIMKQRLELQRKLLLALEDWGQKGLLQTFSQITINDHGFTYIPGSSYLPCWIIEANIVLTKNTTSETNSRLGISIMDLAEELALSTGLSVEQAKLGIHGLGNAGVYILLQSYSA